MSNDCALPAPARFRRETTHTSAEPTRCHHAFRTAADSGHDAESQRLIDAAISVVAVPVMGAPEGLPQSNDGRSVGNRTCL